MYAQPYPVKSGQMAGVIDIPGVDLPNTVDEFQEWGEWIKRGADWISSRGDAVKGAARSTQYAIDNAQNLTTQRVNVSTALAIGGVALVAVYLYSTRKR